MDTTSRHTTPVVPITSVNVLPQDLQLVCDAEAEHLLCNVDEASRMIQFCQDKSNVNTSEWKPWRRLNSLHFYKHRSNSCRSMAFGSQFGSLMDLLEGVVASNTSTFRRQQSLLFPELIDAQVLHNLDTSNPTSRHSIQCASPITRTVKWIAVKSLVPKAKVLDLLFLEQVGTIRDVNGIELTYRLRFSIELPDDLSSSAVVWNDMSEKKYFGMAKRKSALRRCKLSTCEFFRQITTEYIGVYMTGDFDEAMVLDGKAERKHKLFSPLRKSTAPLYVRDLVVAKYWTATTKYWEHSHATKFGMLIRADLPASSTPKNRDSLRKLQARRWCELCYTSLSLLKKTKVCRACGKAVCSRCRVNKTVFSSDLTTEPNHSACIGDFEHVRVCLNCVCRVALTTSDGLRSNIHASSPASAYDTSVCSSPVDGLPVRPASTRPELENQSKDVSFNRFTAPNVSTATGSKSDVGCTASKRVRRKHNRSADFMPSNFTASVPGAKELQGLKVEIPSVVEEGILLHDDDEDDRIMLLTSFEAKSSNTKLEKQERGSKYEPIRLLDVGNGVKTRQERAGAVPRRSHVNLTSISQRKPCAFLDDDLD